MSFKLLILKYLTLWSLALVAPYAYSDIQIAVYDIQGLHQEDHSGSYDKILLAIRNKGVNLSIMHVPIIRAKHLFRTKQLNCISPADASNDPFPFPSIQTKPLNTAKAYIFRRKEDGVISGLKDLKGLTIGIRKGLEFGGRLEQHKLNLEPVWSTEQNYKKLLNHRVDAFIAYIPDIWGYFNSQEMSLLTYDKEQPIITYHESVACHTTAENQNFINHFNQALEQLKQEDVIKELLGRSYNLD